MALRRPGQLSLEYWNIGNVCFVYDNNHKFSVEITRYNDAKHIVWYEFVIQRGYVIPSLKEVLGEVSARFCVDAFYPRDAMLARVFATVTCLSVCLSVTSRYCVKTKKASVMISSPSGSPTILVFWCQISSQNSKGFPPIGSIKQGRGG